jgi:hypothetical protein
LTRGVASVVGAIERHVGEPVVDDEVEAVWQAAS